MDPPKIVRTPRKPRSRPTTGESSAIPPSRTPSKSPFDNMEDGLAKSLAEIRYSRKRTPEPVNTGKETSDLEPNPPAQAIESKTDTNENVEETPIPINQSTAIEKETAKPIEDIAQVSMPAVVRRPRTPRGQRSAISPGIEEPLKSTEPQPDLSTLTPVVRRPRTPRGQRVLSTESGDKMKEPTLDSNVQDIEQSKDIQEDASKEKVSAAGIGAAAALAIGGGLAAGAGMTSKTSPEKILRKRELQEPKVIAPQPETPSKLHEPSSGDVGYLPLGRKSAASLKDESNKAESIVRGKSVPATISTTITLLETLRSEQLLLESQYLKKQLTLLAQKVDHLQEEKDKEIEAWKNSAHEAQNVLAIWQDAYEDVLPNEAYMKNSLKEAKVEFDETSVIQEAELLVSNMDDISTEYVQLHRREFLLQSEVSRLLGHSMDSLVKSATIDDLPEDLGAEMKDLVRDYAELKENHEKMMELVKSDGLSYENYVKAFESV